MKKTKIIFTILFSLILCLSSCSENKDTESTAPMDNPSQASPNSSQTSDESSHDHIHDDGSSFYLSLTAEPSKDEAGVINAIITLDHLHCEMIAIEFSLTYSSNTVEGIYKTNDEMAKTMTIVPMYKTTHGVMVPAYEQICVYKKDSSLYKCMYTDLLSYPLAEAGQEIQPLKNAGEFVITIPFKVNETASAGDTVTFDFISGSVKGTSSGYEGVKGAGNSVTYTLTEGDIVK